MSVCVGQQPKSNYLPPGCPRGNCGLCYKVTNQGGYNGASTKGVGNSIIVQIIDSCPAVNAWNFCKTKIPANERCESRDTNQLDIDRSAYKALTGQESGFVSRPLVTRFDQSLTQSRVRVWKSKFRPSAVQLVDTGIFEQAEHRRGGDILYMTRSMCNRDCAGCI